MRVTVDARKMASVLQRLSSTPVNSAIEISQEIRIEASSAGYIVVTATSGTIHYLIKIQADVIQPGNCLVESRALRDIIKTFSITELEIHMDFDAEKGFRLIAGKSVFPLTGSSISLFPETTTSNLENIFCIDSNSLKGALVRTSVSRQDKLSRHTPQGVIIDLMNDSVQVVCVNEKSLSREIVDSDIDFSNVDFNSSLIEKRYLADGKPINRIGDSPNVEYVKYWRILLSNESAAMIQRVATGELKMSASDDRLVWSWHDSFSRSKIIIAGLPRVNPNFKWRVLLRKPSMYRFEISVSKLRALLTRANIMLRNSKDTDGVILKRDGDKLAAYAKLGIDFELASFVDGTSKFRCLLDCQLFLSGLSGFSDDNVVVDIGDDDSHIFLRPPDGSSDSYFFCFAKKIEQVT